MENGPVPLPFVHLSLGPAPPCTAGV